jgi:hypothetical protein
VNECLQATVVNILLEKRGASTSQNDSSKDFLLSFSVNAQVAQCQGESLAICIAQHSSVTGIQQASKR